MLLRRNLSESELQQLSFRLGPALPIFTGAVIAHHVLDLQQPAHRAALCKLVQWDAVYAAQQRTAFGDYGVGASLGEGIAIYGGSDMSTMLRGGTSQNGDYSGFRNAILNGSPVSVHILQDLAANFGDAGLDAHPALLQGRAVLHVDYAGVLRAPLGATIATEFHLALLLHKSGLHYSVRHVQGNPHLARVLPDVLWDNWARNQRLKRNQMIQVAKHASRNASVCVKGLAWPEISAMERRVSCPLQAGQHDVIAQAEKPTVPSDKDLLGKARPSQLEDYESFCNWLEARGVPCKIWDETTRDEAYSEFSSSESNIECEFERGNSKQARRIAVARTVHVTRVRISSPLLDKVLTWQLVPCSSKGKTAQGVVEDVVPRHVVPKASSKPSGAEMGTTRASFGSSMDFKHELSARHLQRSVRARWARAAEFISTGGESKVRTFITARLRLDAGGHIVTSPARTAARAVLSQLCSHLGAAALQRFNESDVRIIFRKRDEVNHSPVEPRVLVGLRTKAFVYYYEAYVNGLPDQMPRLPSCNWKYRWTSSDAAEDVPVRAEALPKVIANFRMRTSAFFFTSIQVRKIVNSFLNLAREQQLDVSGYNEPGICCTDNGAPMGASLRWSPTSCGGSCSISTPGDLNASSVISQGSQVLSGPQEDLTSKQFSIANNDSDSPLDGGDRSNKVGLEAIPERKTAVAAQISTLDTYMLDLTVHLFSRTVDVENFYWTCVAYMPLQLRNALIDRIGWLNVLNVEHCETRYELDLRLSDHWKMAHILTQLAANEEGINFCEASFCRTHTDAPIPGWNLPASWDIVNYTGNLTKGIPRCGLLKVTYKADPGDTVPFRRRLGLRYTLLGVPRPVSDPLDSACCDATTMSHVS